MFRFSHTKYGREIDTNNSIEYLGCPFQPFVILYLRIVTNYQASCISSQNFSEVL